MAEKLRTNFKIGDILSPEDVNRTNATINANLDSIKATEDAVTSAATSASSAAQAAENASGYLSDLQVAIQDLPDGQAVTAEVAQHTVSIEGLEGATTLGQDELGNDIKPSDVLQNKSTSGFASVVTDEEGHLVEALLNDGTKVFSGNVEAPNIQLHEEAIIQNAEAIDTFHGEFDEAMKQQQTINEKSVLGQIGGEDIHPSDVSEVKQAYNILHGITDAEGHLLFWIDKDANIQWARGVPEPMKDYTTTRMEELKEVYGDYIKRDDYIQIVCDAEGRIVYGIKANGDFDWKSGIPDHLKEYIEAHGGSEGNVVEPSLAADTLQNVPSVLQEGIMSIGVRLSGFMLTDNPLLGIKWQLDNFDITSIRVGLNKNLFAHTDGVYDYTTITDKMYAFNAIIRYANEHNMPVILTINCYPPYNNKRGSVSQEDFKIIVNYVLTYNGVTQHTILRDGVLYDNTDTETYPCKVDAIKFFDEIEDKTIHDAQEWLDMLDEAITYVKERRSDMKFVSPSSGIYRIGYHLDMGTCVSANGHHFSDLFDSYSLDPWAEDVRYTDTNILKAYALSNPADSYNKPFNTVNGYSPTVYSEAEQGERTIETIITHIALGASEYNYFATEYDQNEYYILNGTFQNAAHLYCTRASGEGRIITGNAYDDIVLGVGSQYWNSDAKLHDNQVPANRNNLAANLKAHGLQISGSTGLHVTSVKIGNTEVWDTEQDVSVTPIVLASSVFSDLTLNDVIIISTDAPKQMDTGNNIALTEVVPRLGALYIKYLCTLLHAGCTRPVIKQKADYYIASWYNENNKPVYLLYRNRNASTPTVSLEVSGNFYVTNLKGEVQSVDVSSISLAYPIYILNANNIKIL